MVGVPGLGLEAAEWQATSEALCRDLGARAAVRQLPGYGRRPLRGEDLRPASLGERLATDLRGRTLLMGHSASCQVVARAAHLVPERVSALVLAGPTTDPRASSWPRLVERWLRTAAHESPRQVPFLLRSYARTGPGWMLRAMEAARHEDVRTDLRAVTCPVLVVRGRHDRICPADWADELASVGPPGSRAVTLPEGGHMVPLTHGGLVAAAVTRWLAEAPPSGE